MVRANCSRKCPSDDYKSAWSMEYKQDTTNGFYHATGITDMEAASASANTVKQVESKKEEKYVEGCNMERNEVKPAKCLTKFPFELSRYEHDNEVGCEYNHELHHSISSIVVHSDAYTTTKCKDLPPIVTFVEEFEIENPTTEQLPKQPNLSHIGVQKASATVKFTEQQNTEEVNDTTVVAKTASINDVAKALEEIELQHSRSIVATSVFWEVISAKEHISLGVFECSIVMDKLRLSKACVGKFCALKGLYPSFFSKYEFVNDDTFHMNFDPGGKWSNKLGMETEQGQKQLSRDSRYLWLNTADAYKLPKSRDVPIDAAGHDAIIVGEEENAQLIASNLPIKKAKSECAIAAHLLASTHSTGEEIPIVIETRMIISELKLSNIYGVQSIVEEKNEAFHRSLALVLISKTPKGSIPGAFHAKFIDQTLQGPPIQVARVDGICMTLQDQVSHKHEEQRDDKLPKLVNRFGGGMSSSLNDNGNLAYKSLGKCMAIIYSVTKHLSFLIDPGGALYPMRTRGTSLTTEISIDFLSFGTGHGDHAGILLSVALYMIFDPGGNGQNGTESEITLDITFEITDDETVNILEQVKLVIAKVEEAVHRKAF